MKNWVKVTGVNNPKAKICGLHFKPDDFMDTKTTKRRRLKPNAVPSLLLPALDANVSTSQANCRLDHPHGHRHEIGVEPTQQVSYFSESSS